MNLPDFIVEEILHNLCYIENKDLRLVSFKWQSILEEVLDYNVKDRFNAYEPSPFDKFVKTLYVNEKEDIPKIKQFISLRRVHFSGLSKSCTSTDIALATDRETNATSKVEALILDLSSVDASSLKLGRNIKSLLLIIDCETEPFRLYLPHVKKLYIGGLTNGLEVMKNDGFLNLTSLDISYHFDQVSKTGWFPSIQSLKEVYIAVDSSFQENVTYSLIFPDPSEVPALEILKVNAKVALNILTSSKGFSEYKSVKYLHIHNYLNQPTSLIKNFPNLRKLQLGSLEPSYYSECFGNFPSSLTHLKFDHFFILNSMIPILLPNITSLSITEALIPFVLPMVPNIKILEINPFFGNSTELEAPDIHLESLLWLYYASLKLRSLEYILQSSPNLIGICCYGDEIHNYVKTKYPAIQILPRLNFDYCSF